jgi:hypothetical protein
MFWWPLLSLSPKDEMRSADTIKTNKNETNGGRETRK